MINDLTGDYYRRVCTLLLGCGRVRRISMSEVSKMELAFIVAVMLGIRYYM